MISKYALVEQSITLDRLILRRRRAVFIVGDSNFAKKAPLCGLLNASGENESDLAQGAANRLSFSFAHYRTGNNFSYAID